MTINIFGFNLGIGWPPFGVQNQEVRRLRKYEKRAAAIHAEMRGAKLSQSERLTQTQLLEVFRDCHTGCEAQRRLEERRLAAPYYKLLAQYWMYGKNLPEGDQRGGIPSNETGKKETEENGPNSGPFSSVSFIDCFPASGLIQ